MTADPRGFRSVPEHELPPEAYGRLALMSAAEQWWRTELTDGQRVQLWLDLHEQRVDEVEAARQRREGRR